MRNDTDIPRTIANVQLEDGSRLIAETPSLGIFTLSFEPAVQPAAPVNADETEPDATVGTQIELVDGPVIDVEPTDGNIEVTISCSGRAHAGIALSRSEAQALATALMDAAAPNPADDLADEPSDESLHRWRFPRTRTWRGEKVPASGVHLYRTVDQRDVVEVEYVDTPEGPVMLIDGRRPISLDDTNRFMTDVALYRHATDAVNAMILRREAGTR